MQINTPKRAKASPLARKIAKERGVSLANLRGTGPGGRIIKRDLSNAPVGNFLEGGDSRDAQNATLVGEKISITLEIDAQPMIELCTQLSPSFEETDPAGMILLKAINDTLLNQQSINQNAPLLFQYFTPKQGLREKRLSPEERKNKTLAELFKIQDKASAQLPDKEAIHVLFLGNQNPAIIFGANLGAGTLSFCFGGVQKKPVLNKKGKIISGATLQVNLSASKHILAISSAVSLMELLQKKLENPTLSLV